MDVWKYGTVRDYEDAKLIAKQLETFATLIAG